MGILNLISVLLLFNVRIEKNEKSQNSKNKIINLLEQTQTTDFYP